MQIFQIYEELKSRSSDELQIFRYLRFIIACREKNQKSDYLEKHHILPKCKTFFYQHRDFRSNRWNRVDLTPRQHIIAHWMLAKVLGGTMWDAVWQMNNKKGGLNSRLYQKAREEFSSRQSIRTKLLWEKDEFRNKMSDMKTDFWKDEEKRQQSSSAMKDAWTSERRKEQGKRSTSNIQNLNSDPDFIKKRNEASRQLMLERSKDPEWLAAIGERTKKMNASKKTCPHCNAEVNPGNYGRYHGDKCRSLTLSQKRGSLRV